MKKELVKLIVEKKLAKGMCKAKCCQLFHR